MRDQEGLEAELTAARREAALAKVHSAERAARLQAELDRSQARFDRLSRRRAVRLAVRLASLLRPVVTLTRRLRRRGQADRSAPRTATEDRHVREGELGTVHGISAPSFTAGRPTAEIEAGMGEIDIVVPVHNAFDDVQECLGSLVASMSECVRLIIVDDGSDEATATLCRHLSSSTPRSELIRHETASGFSRAANAGLRASTAELVVLLNSDVIVSPSWHLKLARVVRSAPDIGIVGPLSNAATGQSIPITKDKRGRLAINELPPGFTPMDLDFFCEDRASHLPIPRVQLINGFCMMLTRTVMEAVGYLDEQAFPFGYGEEVDYCFRAADAGFGLAVAIDTFVYHAKSRSYGRDRARELRRVGSQTLAERWGRERLEHARESVQRHPVLVEMRRAAQPLWQFGAAERTG